MHSGHQEKATGDQIRSSKITVLCMPSPSRTSNGSALPCSTILRKCTYRVDVVAGDANAAAYRFYKRQEYQDLYNSSVAVMLREMQRGIIMGRPFESRLHIDYSTSNHHSQLRPADDLDRCFMAILSWGKPPGPRIMKRLWSNTRERTQNKEQEQAEDCSYPKVVEVMPRETGRKSYPDPENIGNPMIAPQDFEFRQSGRVLEFQNRDLWI